MLKSELAQRLLAQNPHLYQRDAEDVVNAILGEILAAMARGDRVELRGFGAFTVKQASARMRRNPKNGVVVLVDQQNASSSSTRMEEAQGSACESEGASKSGRGMIRH